MKKKCGVESLGFFLSVEVVSRDSAKKICEIFHFNRSDVFFFQSQMTECQQKRMAQLYLEGVYCWPLVAYTRHISTPQQTLQVLGRVPCNGTSQLKFLSLSGLRRKKKKMMTIERK